MPQPREDSQLSRPDLHDINKVLSVLGTLHHINITSLPGIEKHQVLSFYFHSETAISCTVFNISRLLLCLLLLSNKSSFSQPWDPKPPQQRPALHGSFGRYQHGRRNAVLHSTWQGRIWIPTAAIQPILRDSQQFLDFKSGLSFQKMKRFMLHIEHHGEEVRYPSRKKKGGPVRLLQPRIFVKPLEVWQVKFRIMNQQL